MKKSLMISVEKTLHLKNVEEKWPLIVSIEEVEDNIQKTIKAMMMHNLIEEFFVKENLLILIRRADGMCAYFRIYVFELKERFDYKEHEL